MHNKGEVKEDSPKKTPELILFYNSTKGAVDALDKMVHSYTSKRKSKRWPMAMLSNVLDISTVAARCVWSIKFKNDILSHKDQRSAFITNVSKQMMLPQMRRRFQTCDKGPFSRELVQLIQVHMERIETTPSSQQSASRVGVTRRTEPKKRQNKNQEGLADGEPAPKKSRGRCCLCPWQKDRKVKARCQRCNAYVCPDHTLSLCSNCCDKE